MLSLGQTFRLEGHMRFAGELTRGVLMAMGGLFAVAILVLIASLIVSALF